MKEMTTAFMDWENLTLKVEGHAEYGEKGKDIVCAAESMLVCALAETLENAAQRGRTTIRLEQEDGKAMISANPCMECRAEIKAYFRLCVTGLKMLQQEYREHIKVREV